MTDLQHRAQPDVAPAPSPPPHRARRWAATMAGHPRPGGWVAAHGGPPPAADPTTVVDRAVREAQEDRHLAPGATRAVGGGHRGRPETPDPVRTCFERDRDRILHAPAFRRLAGKTQVFIFPDDHQRTRLTHALEVAQVAGAVARACRLNVALTEAIALGHDCGHGPGGHAAEDALTPYVREGFDHAVWGAEVALARLNLCAETLDGIRNHSWSRPSPTTPEGAVVSWADRIAYCCHDLEDAVAAGIVGPGVVPPLVAARCGTTRSEQLDAFIGGLVAGIAATGEVVMAAPLAEALAELRSFCHERIYLRPASRRQAESVERLLRALVEHAADRPQALPAGSMARSGIDPDDAADVAAGSAEALRAAVAWVAGMTDRYACAQAVSRLGWRRHDLPAGIDLVP